MLDYLRIQPNVKDVCLVVKDFTKIFVTPMSLAGFLQKGGRLMVLQRPNLLAICINPVSPMGYTMDSDALRQALQSEIEVPVYDVMKVE